MSASFQVPETKKLIFTIKPSKTDNHDKFRWMEWKGSENSSFGKGTADANSNFTSRSWLKKLGMLY